MSDTTKRIRVVAEYNGAQLERGMHSATGGLGGLASMASRAVAGLGALEAARRGLQLAETAQAAQGAEAALVAFSGGAEQAAANLAAVQRAAAGGVSEMQAFGVANRLLALNIVEGSAQMEQFTRDAILLSKAMGMDAAAGLENISAAIANLSYVRLDQMGLSAAAARERVGELTTGVNALSTEQAFAQAVMEQMAVKADALAEAGLTTANAFDQSRAAIEDFKLGIGDAINAGLTPLMEGLTGLNALLAENGIGFRDLAADAFLWSTGLQGIVTNQGAANAAWSEFTARNQDAAVGSEHLTSMLDILAAAAATVEEPVMAGSVAFAAATGSAYDLIDAVDQVPGGVDAMSAAFVQAAEDAGYTAEEAGLLWGVLYQSGPAAAAAIANSNATGVSALRMASDMREAAAAAREMWAAVANRYADHYDTAGSGAARKTNLERLQFNDRMTAGMGTDEGTLYALPSQGAKNKYIREQGEQIRLDAKAREDARVAAAKAAADAEALARRTSTAVGRSAASGARASGAASRAASAAAGKAARESEAAAKKLQREQEKAARDAAREAERAAATVERAWMAAYNKVSGAVSRGMNLSTSIGPNDALLDMFGMRMEGPSEILRRLQDVVNRGDESEWAQFYAEALGLGPGTGDLIKARAAQLMQEIEMGFRNDLIDREALKRQVRRELEGELMKAQLIDEVARELLAEGYGTEEIERVLQPMTPDLSITPRLALEGATLAPLPEMLITPSDQLVLSERMGTQMSAIMSTAGAESGPAFVRSIIDSIAVGIEAQAGAIMARGRRMGELMADGIADAVASVIVDRIAEAMEATV